ncbi:hypothetical protein Zmor_027291 [Zophobas morio]|uniref:Uncharacterized protein n=1 Tax=Zophobas morio TaxID=2755281 RepID=A0AA38M1V3_9CUCU|nr:hypothetical protein Zmor_027291 [Zophobas morio]
MLEQETNNLIISESLIPNVPNSVSYTVIIVFKILILLVVVRTTYYLYLKYVKRQKVRFLPRMMKRRKPIQVPESVPMHSNPSAPEYIAILGNSRPPSPAPSEASVIRRQAGQINDKLKGTYTTTIKPESLFN